MNRLPLYLLLCICCIKASCYAQYGTQFDNRGFEEWANFGSGNSTNEPVHWHSGMSASGSYSSWLSQQIEQGFQVRPGSTGSRSARIWAVSIIGIIANGNMANGRMNAGSMSATGSGNYNYTQRSDDRFNTPINTVPDSLTVWVCFRTVNPDQNAQISAYIHGDCDFKCLANGGVEPSDMKVATASLSFKRTYESDGYYSWKRLSIPFVMDGPCSDPRYILLCATTNMNPGQGSDGDDMFIDDVLLIYNPSITMEPLASQHYLTGESLTIHYTLNGTMSPDNLNGPANQVIAQLSSANGSFSTPIELGRMTTNSSGSISVRIPSGIYVGEHYRIRLVTTNYPMISNDNGTDLTIGEGNEIAESAMEEEILGMEIYDLSGRKMTDADLAPGLYIVRYITNKGVRAEKHIISQ